MPFSLDRLSAFQCTVGIIYINAANVMVFVFLIHVGVPLITPKSVILASGSTIFMLRRFLILVSTSERLEGKTDTKSILNNIAGLTARTTTGLDNNSYGRRPSHLKKMLIVR